MNRHIMNTSMAMAGVEFAFIVRLIALNQFFKGLFVYPLPGKYGMSESRLQGFGYVCCRV